MESRLFTTILVADDNRENRALAQATFEDEGYRVVLAHSGEEAVAKVAAEHPDCILMDIRMPTIDGIVACEISRTEVSCTDVKASASAWFSGDVCYSVVRILAGHAVLRTPPDTLVLPILEN